MTSEARKARNAGHCRAMRRRKKKRGLCIDGGCWEPALPGQTKCEEHRIIALHSRMREYRDRRDRERARIYSHGYVRHGETEVREEEM